VFLLATHKELFGMNIKVFERRIEVIETIFKLAMKTDSDPITDIFNHDWAAVGGWSLFLALVILVLIAFFSGRIVPGWMYREQGRTLDQAMEQNRKLLATADITKHFFESTAKKPSQRERAVRPNVRKEVKDTKAEA
jgi:hypothetical protein